MNKFCIFVSGKGFIILFFSGTMIQSLLQLLKGLFFLEEGVFLMKINDLEPLRFAKAAFSLYYCRIY